MKSFSFRINVAAVAINAGTTREEALEPLVADLVAMDPVNAKVYVAKTYARCADWALADAAVTMARKVVA